MRGLRGCTIKILLSLLAIIFDQYYYPLGALDHRRMKEAEGLLVCKDLLQGINQMLILIIIVAERIMEFVIVL